MERNRIAPQQTPPVRDEIATVNERHWKWAVRKGAGCTIPWLDLDAELLRRCVRDEQQPVPVRLANIIRTLSGLLHEIEGKDVLCLAAGGGQQSAVFGLLGAHVTVVDLCDSQLEGDRKAAAHYGYRVTAILGDMRDLSDLEDASFDLVYGTGMWTGFDRRFTIEQDAEYGRHGHLFSTHEDRRKQTSVICRIAEVCFRSTA
jgi:SAM-dependent methyltransferase